LKMTGLNGIAPFLRVSIKSYLGVAHSSFSGVLRVEFLDFTTFCY